MSTNIAPVTPYSAELNQFAASVATKMVARVTNQTEEQTNRDPTSNPVGKFLSPTELDQDLHFEIPETQNIDFVALEKKVDFLMKTTTRADHPMYFNQLFAGPDPVGIIGDWLGATMNCTMATYENCGAFVMMEQAVMKMLRKEIGWADGAGDGQLCPGGSACNQMGVMLARYAKCPAAKLEGNSVMGKVHLYTSTESHYSLDKAAFACGFGLNSLVRVPCDATGAMCAASLEELVQKSIADGVTPLVVNATAGTTVRGAYDPFDKIGDICEKYGMWMHVDGAWGGPAIMSRKYPELCKGIEKADSVTLDGHKMLGMTQQCAMVLVKRTDNIMHKCNSANAAYLFQADKPHAEHDTGDKTIQCGRRNDILKLWLCWQGLGVPGAASRVDTTLGLGRALYGKLQSESRKAEGFLAIQAPACSNTCFYFIPDALRADPIAVRLFAGESPYELLRKPEAKAFCDAVTPVAPFIKKRTIENGSMMCGFQAVCGLPNFWRMVFSNPRVAEAELEAVLDIIALHGKEWSAAQ